MITEFLPVFGNLENLKEFLILLKTLKSHQKFFSKKSETNLSEQENESRGLLFRWGRGELNIWTHPSLNLR